MRLVVLWLVALVFIYLCLSRIVMPTCRITSLFLVAICVHEVFYEVTSTKLYLCLSLRSLYMSLCLLVVSRHIGMTMCLYVALIVR